MLELFTLPSANDIITNSSDYANPFFLQFLPILYVVIALTAAVGLVLFLSNAIKDGILHLTERKRPNDDWTWSRNMREFDLTGKWPK